MLLRNSITKLLYPFLAHGSSEGYCMFACIPIISEALNKQTKPKPERLKNIVSFIISMVVVLIPINNISKVSKFTTFHLNGLL